MIDYTDLMLESENPDDDKLLATVRKMLGRIQTEFVDHLGPIKSVNSEKLLGLFDLWRQTSLRRAHDLAESAQALFGQDRLIPACSLTRSVFETVGVQYYIYKKLMAHSESNEPVACHKLLMSAVFGRKDAVWPEKPIQVLTAVDHMDKEFSGSRAEYDRLCEYAHPNMHGGAGTYSLLKKATLEARFGVNPNGLKMGPWGLTSLHLILLICAEVNNRLCSSRPKLVCPAEKSLPKTKH